MTRRVLKRTAFVFLWPVLCLFFLEGAVRIQEPFFHLLKKRDVSRAVKESLFLYQVHPLWDHSLNSKIHRKIFRAGEEFLYETNSMGFRQPWELRQPKPPGVFRIFVLGDSFTEGSGPSPTVTDWIQKALSKRYPSAVFEVVNAGVASQSPILYMIRLQRQIFALNPDLILVNIDNTDVRDDLHLWSQVQRDAGGFPWEIPLQTERYHSLLQWAKSPASRYLYKAGQWFWSARLFWDAVFRLKERAFQLQVDFPSPAGIPEELLHDYSWIKHLPLSPAEEAAFSKWKPAVEELVRLCRRQKVPLLLSSYPHPKQVTGKAGTSLQSFLRVESERLGVPYFDALPALKAFSVSQLYLDHDIHYNSFGNQKWGEALGMFVGRALADLFPERFQKGNVPGEPE